MDIPKWKPRPRCKDGCSFERRYVCLIMWQRFEACRHCDEYRYVAPDEADRRELRRTNYRA
jgi:hypothetical protein